MPEPFRTQRRVEFRDTDAAGIMHFSAILGTMEEAEHDLWRSIGVPLFAPTDRGLLSWPRVAAHAEFKSPARFEDTLDIEILIQRMGRRSVTFTFRLSCQQRLVATGEMTSVHSRLHDGQLAGEDIPADVRERLQPFVVPEN